MAILTARYTLGTATPVLIAKSHHMAQDVIVHNMSKSSNEYIYIGNADVSATNSIHIDPGETVYLKLQANDVLYVISDVDPIDVGVFQSLQ